MRIPGAAAHLFPSTVPSHRVSLAGKVEGRGAGILTCQWPKAGKNAFPTRSLRLPLDEAFQGIELGQAKLIVNLGRVPVSFLSSLPELARVDAAGKHRPVLLRLVPENGHLLALQVLGAQGHDALDHMRLPFLPGAAVEPDLEHLSLLADL